MELRSVTFAALLVAVSLLVACSDPDRVVPVDNTGQNDDASSNLDAPGGLDATDAGRGQVNGCASDQDCLAILGAIPTCEAAVCKKSVCELINAVDASPCDDGNPCTQNTTCLGGSCMKGKPTSCHDDNPCTDDACALPGGCTFTANHASCAGSGCSIGVCGDSTCSTAPRYGATHWADRRVRALVADGDGWIAAMQVAVTSTDAAAPTPQNRWSRLDAVGASYADLPLEITAVNAATRASQGDVIFAGAATIQAPDGGLSRDGAMVRVGLDGTPRWRRTYHRGANDELRAVVGLADDTVAACGRTELSDGTGEAWYVRGSSPTGFPLFDYIFGSAQDETCNGLLALPNDELLMVGAQTGVSGNGQALAFRITHNAKLVWNRTWGGKGHDEVYAAALRPDGSTWLAGRCADQPGGVTQGCLWVLSAKGDVLMSRILLKPGLGDAVAPAAAELFAVVAQPGGGVVVGGRARPSPAAPWRAIAMWRDGNANPVATRFPLTGPGFFRAMAMNPQGGVALAGAASTTDAPSLPAVANATAAIGGAGVVVRMTPWGVACVGTAPCVEQPANACDDKDPCTVDWCGVTCDHAPLAEGAPCGDDKTCQSKVCAETP